jgi:hypothetical protein
VWLVLGLLEPRTDDWAAPIPPVASEMRFRGELAAYRREREYEDARLHMRYPHLLARSPPSVASSSGTPASGGVSSAGDDDSRSVESSSVHSGGDISSVSSGGGSQAGSGQGQGPRPPARPKSKDALALALEGAATAGIPPACLPSVYCIHHALLTASAAPPLQAQPLTVSRQAVLRLDAGVKVRWPAWRLGACLQSPAESDVARDPQEFVKRIMSRCIHVMENFVPESADDASLGWSGETIDSPGKGPPRIITPDILFESLRLTSKNPRDPIGRLYPTQEQLEDLFAGTFTS